MYLKTAKILPDGKIILPADIQENMKLSAGDNVALIYDNGRVILRKLTSGDGMMTFEEFLIYRNVAVKNSDHKRIIKMFYKYSGSVSGNNRLLPDIIGRLLNIDTSSYIVSTSCFNGIFDSTEPPYEGVDLYVRFNNDIRIFIYGSIPLSPLKELKDNEYVIFILSDNINGNIERKANGYIYLT